MPSIGTASCPNMQAQIVQAPRFASSAIRKFPWFSVMKVSLPPSRASLFSGPQEIL